jgi:hypothetical protein
METVASVHRFKGNVAIHVGGGGTVYLTPKEAAALAAALQKCKRDILKNDFVHSGFSKVDIKRRGGWH